MHPFRVQLVQEFKARMTFTLEILYRFSNFNKTLFLDETHFHLNDVVNRQNCRYWSKQNSKLKHTKNQCIVLK